MQFYVIYLFIFVLPKGLVISICLTNPTDSLDFPRCGNLKHLPVFSCKSNMQILSYNEKDINIIKFKLMRHVGITRVNLHS